MLSHPLLPSFSFLRSSGRIATGRRYPLGRDLGRPRHQFRFVFGQRRRRSSCACSTASGRREIERIALPERTDDVWHVYLPHVAPGQLYGYRVHGPYEPERGPPLQSAQAADRPLQQAARRPLRLDRRAFRLPHRRQAARTCRSTGATTRARCQVGRGRRRASPGATTQRPRVPGKTPSSTRRTSKA